MKRFFFLFVDALAFVVLSVLYFLSIAQPDKYGWFTIGRLISIFTGILGASLVLSALVSKGVVNKKFRILAAVILFIICVVSCIYANKYPTNFVLPLILIVVALGIFISVLFTGGAKWDDGDNQKAGYKDYYARKKEQEELETKQKKLDEESQKENK